MSHTITGNSAGATGIFNGGIIDTEDGKDTITGTSTATGSSFGGSGIVNLSSTAPTSIDITFDSATMSFTDVELFDFNGQEFALEQLQDIV